MNRNPLAEFEFITENVNVGNSNSYSDIKSEDQASCGCIQKDDDAICTDEKCINYATLVECVRCKSNCQNNRISKHRYAKFEARESGDKGHGLFVLEDLDPGTFITEYIGEVVSSAELDRRMQASTNEKHLYVMQLKKDTFIDGRRKSSVARFINHSCDPNCTVEIWTVAGKLRAGIFTIKPVLAGDELSFDYQWVRSRRSLTR